jgi:hypothetical protein
VYSSESPEWDTEQELFDIEEAKAQRERQIERDAQDARELKVARKTPRLLPFEIEELAAKKRAQIEDAVESAGERTPSSAFPGMTFA